MTKSEDTMSGKTVAQTETSTESDNDSTRTSSEKGGYGDKENFRNNTRDSLASTSKYYKGVIEAFGAVLALNYDKVELNKSLDVFREKLINYTIEELKNAEDVLVLVQDMEDPKASFDTKK